MKYRSKTWQFLTLVVAVGVIGCQSSDQSETAPAEQPLAVQLAAARDGTTDRIHIEHERLTDNDLQAISDLSSLRVLLLDHAESRFSSTGLDHLVRLEHLEHLRIRSGGLDDAALAQIARIKSLRILNLPQATFTDAALVNLKKLSNLEQLRFGSPRVTDAGMKTIAELPALKRLHLIDVPITDAGLADLAGMMQLESLYIDGSHISDAAFENLFRSRPDLHVHLNQRHHDHDPHQHPHP